MELEDDQLALKDFLSGPLDEYRKQAKFDWKKLKFFFENPDLLKLKVWKTSYYSNYASKSPNLIYFFQNIMIVLVFFF